MASKQTNGNKLARGIVLALALLVLPLSGMASAEAGAADRSAAQMDKTLGLDALVVDAHTDVAALDADVQDALELAKADLEMQDGEALDLTGAEERMNEVAGIVLFINTDGEVAWVTVVIYYTDGTVDVSRYGPVDLDVLRERLEGFDGRIIVQWIGARALVHGCPGGTLAGGLQVAEDGTGTFGGEIMDGDGDVIGVLWGTFANGTYNGQFSARDGEITGVLRGVYEAGAFKGMWTQTDGDLNGFMKGHAVLNETAAEGGFRGKWKVACHDGGQDPGPRQAPQDVRDMKQKPMLEQLDDAMEEPLLETEGGDIINVGDAAAGSTLGTIGLLGAGFLRRRITGGL